MAVLAIGFLLLDAVLLGAVAVWAHRPMLFVWSAVLVALAVVVIALRRRHLQSLDEIAQAREALQRELRSLTPDRRSPER